MNPNAFFANLCCQAVLHLLWLFGAGVPELVAKTRRKAADAGSRTRALVSGCWGRCRGCGGASRTADPELVPSVYKSDTETPTNLHCVTLDVRLQALLPSKSRLSIVLAGLNQNDVQVFTYMRLFLCLKWDWDVTIQCSAPLGLGQGTPSHLEGAPFPRR